MPNYVYNTLAVAGANQVLDRFKEQASKQARPHQLDTELSFLNFVRPLDTEMSWYNDGGWYQWNIDNWGCKWDAGQPEIVHESEGRIDYRFSTAWSPPELAFKAMAEEYPSLSFVLRYEEEQGWGGELIAENGNVEQTSQWDIPGRVTK